MLIPLSKDIRQREADVVAVMMLTQGSLQEFELDLSRLGSLVSTYCANENPQTLQEYSAMGWDEAVRIIKVAFIKNYMSSQQIASGELPPPPSVDQAIGNSLVAAFLKFVTYRSINPDWYAPHLAQMRLAEMPAPSL